MFSEILKKQKKSIEVEVEDLGSAVLIELVIWAS